MSILINESLDLLKQMYDDQSHLFSYSSRINNGFIINDFSNSAKYRYTINTILAIQKLEQYAKSPWRAIDLLNIYITNHLRRDINIGNRGLLLHILSSSKHEYAKEIFDWLLTKLPNSKTILKQPVQEISWVSFGITTYAKMTGDSKASSFSNKLINLLLKSFMNPNTLLPIHNGTMRGRFVSFGGIVYFLMALQHYANEFNNEKIRQVFLKAVQQIIQLQGENGEWPWFLDTYTGNVMDWYQVYSVHQDSMSMLFLLPALDMGLAEAAPAIRKSYQWLFGNNQLNTEMIQQNPFFIFRSIRRNENLERPRRILRTYLRAANSSDATMIKPAHLCINTECRSYHIAWIVYVWAGRAGFEEFTELNFCQHEANIL